MASKTVKGIVIEIDGNTSGLAKSLDKVQSDLKETYSNLKDVNKALKFDSSNAEMLARKQQLLTDAIEETRQKLQLEEESARRAKEALEHGDISVAEYDKIQAEILKTKSDLEGLEKTLREIPTTSQLAFQKAGKDLQEFGDKAQKAGEKVANAGRGISSVGQTLTATVTAPIVGAGAYAIKTASDFEDAFAKLATIADTTEVPVDELRKSIMNLAEETGQSSAEVADAVYSAISAGQSTKNAVGFVETSAKLAQAGFTSTTVATDTLTTALNAYGLSASEAERIANELITTQNLGKTTVDELGSSMGRVIPTANLTNTSFEQLASAYVTLTKNGIGTAEATTYLSGMLNELNKSGSDADKTLRDMSGKTYDELIKSGKSEDEVVQMLKKHIDELGVDFDYAGMSNKQFLKSIPKNFKGGLDSFTKEASGKGFAELMSEGASLTDVLAMLNEEAQSSGKSITDMFGSQEAGKAGAVLVDKAKDFNDAMKEMEKSTGAMNTAFDTVSNTASFDIKQTKTEIENLAIEIGNDLLPTIRDILKEIQPIVKDLSEQWNSMSAEEKQKFFDNMIALASLGPALQVVGGAVQAIGGAIGGIGKGADGIGKLVEKLGGKGAGAGGGLLGGATFAELLSAGGAGSGATAGTLLTGELGTAVGAGLGLQIIGGLGGALAGFAIAEPLNKYIIAPIKEFFGSDDAIWWEDFSWFGDGGFLDSVFGDYNSIEEWCRIMGGAIKIGFEEQFINPIKEKIDYAKELFELFKIFIGLEKDDIVEHFTSLKDGAIEKINALVENFEILKDALKLMKDDAIGKVDEIKSKFVEMKDEIKSTFDELITSAKQWALDMLENFLSGIIEKGGEVVSAISGVANDIASYIHFSQPDKGALSDFSTYAPDMMKEFAQGIIDNKSLVTNAMSGFAGDIASSVNYSDVLSSINGGVANLASAGGNITIPVYIGNELIDSHIISAINKNNYKSGGR